MSNSTEIRSIDSRLTHSFVFVLPLPRYPLDKESPKGVLQVSKKNKIKNVPNYCGTCC